MHMLKSKKKNVQHYGGFTSRDTRFFFYKDNVFWFSLSIVMVAPFFSLKHSYSIFIFLQYFYLLNSKISKIN